MFCVVRYPEVPSDWSEDKKAAFKEEHKRLIMCNNRVLVQPKREPWENCVFGGITTPLVAEPKSLDDFTIKGGFIIKTQPDLIPLVGVIKHIGKPAPGYREELHAGDEVYLSPDCEFENRIENEDYYVIRQSDILGKYF